MNDDLRTRIERAREALNRDPDRIVVGQVEGPLDLMAIDRSGRVTLVSYDRESPLPMGAFETLLESALSAGYPSLVGDVEDDDWWVFLGRVGLRD